MAAHQQEMWVFFGCLVLAAMLRLLHGSLPHLQEANVDIEFAWAIEKPLLSVCWGLTEKKDKGETSVDEGLHRHTWQHNIGRGNVCSSSVLSKEKKKELKECGSSVWFQSQTQWQLCGLVSFSSSGTLLVEHLTSLLLFGFPAPQHMCPPGGGEGTELSSHRMLSGATFSGQYTWLEPKGVWILTWMHSISTFHPLLAVGQGIQVTLWGRFFPGINTMHALD
jgi:hypothetical protein